MLLLFRNNQFTTAFWLALYVGLTHWAALGGTVRPEQLSPAQGGMLYEVLFGWMARHALYSSLAAAVLVYLQALLINSLADQFRLLQERAWLPGMCYALTAAALPDFLLLSAPLVAATFLPLALRRLFQSYQQTHGAAYVLDAALWVSVAALFYPPAIYLLLAVAASILVMRSFNFREEWVLLIGALIPLMLAGLGFFWADRTGEFIQSQFEGLMGLYRFQIEPSVSNILKVVALVLLMSLVLLNSGRFYYRKLIQTQKCITVLYWFMAIAGGSAILLRDLAVSHFLLLMPSAGIFLSLILSGMRNRMIAEITHLVLLG
ncbi:MAG TPA: hypothetical protein PK971_16470, partial [Saprospiraceae bacterium]|nr:hypothetical protein [Saprospiraceae bacterium]